MNFLIKIEEAINKILLKLIDKLKAFTPDFVFAFLHALKHSPQTIKTKWTKKYQPKLRIMMLKFIGYTEHYTTTVRGTLTSVMIYLRSEEFKKANKKELLMKPLVYAKFNPFKALTFLSSLAVVCLAFSIIFTNTAKILSGTKALRKPASFAEAEEDLYLEFKNHKFEVHQGGGGHGGGGAPEAEVEIHLDVKIEAKSEHDKTLMEEMEEMIDDSMEGMHLPVTGLPISGENKIEIEKMMVKSLNEDFKLFGHHDPVKSIEITQKLSGRPVYYRQAERMIKIEDINLQLFLEDTKRNKQVWLDFSMLASNRNAVIFLRDHEIQLRDHLTTNVEPVIPQLPIEEEGRQIIKDKLRSEIDDFLEKNHIEGKVLEVYLDYLMAS